MAASPWLLETEVVPYAALHSASQFLPPSSQTKAVSAHKTRPDKPDGQMPLHKQAQMAKDEALGWPQATVGPAWSWAAWSSLICD